MSGLFIDGALSYGERGLCGGGGGGIDITLSRYKKINDVFDLRLSYGFCYPQWEHRAVIGLRPLSWLNPYVAFNFWSNSATTTSTVEFYRGIGAPSGIATISNMQTDLGFGVTTGVKFLLSVANDIFGVGIFVEGGIGTVGGMIKAGLTIYLKIPFDSAPKEVKSENRDVRRDASSYYAMGSSDFFKLDEVNKTVDPKNFDPELFAAAIFHATNIVRNQYNLPLFRFSKILYKAARLHCTNMINRNFYDHEDTGDKNNLTVEVRINKFGGYKDGFAENIDIVNMYKFVDGASYYPPERPGGPLRYEHNRQIIPLHTYWSLAKETVSRWMNSTGHRRNILNKTLLRMGAYGNSYFDSKNKLPEAKTIQVFAAGTKD